MARARQKRAVFLFALFGAHLSAFDNSNGDELIDFEEFVQMADKYRRIETTHPEVGLADAFR